MANTIVTFTTSLGSFTVDLYGDAAPVSVQNFLNYVPTYQQNGNFMHRSVPGFVVQGGGYTYSPAGEVSSNTQLAPIQNEFSASRSNLEKTIAWAKLGGDPNSATNQFFFNMGNNSANLDTQNGGFTVFGRVVSGWSVVQQINSLPVLNAGGGNPNSPFTQLPVVNYTTGTVQQSNLVLFSVAVIGQVSAAASENDDILLGTTAAEAINGLGGADTLYGAEGADTVSGGAGADRMDGGEGDDLLSGGADADRLNGGDGVDRVDGGAGLDWMTGGAGADTFVIAVASDSTLAAADAVFDFASGADKIDLSGLAATARVTTGVFGGSGFVYADIDGDGTQDMAMVLSGAPLAGSDLILPGLNGLTMLGDGGVNTLSGTGRADVLAGYGGEDVIIGGVGADQLYGGAGADQFRYLSTGDSTLVAYDYIQDFQAGVDKLDIGALKTSSASTYQLSSFGGATFIYVDGNGDGVQDFVVVAANATLTSADILWGAG